MAKVPRCDFLSDMRTEFGLERQLFWIYVDTRRVRCPAGKFIISVGLTRTFGPDPTNRLTWTLVATKLDGTEQSLIGVSGSTDSNNFPYTGGMSKIWFDCARVICPTESIVMGVFFWEKHNRAAPGLVVRDFSSRIEAEIANNYWGDHLPSGSNGSTDLYADPNMVKRPFGRSEVLDMLQMGGIALHQKGGNRAGLNILFRL